MMTMLLKSILIFIFVVISISDWRTHKIPDRWNAGILLVAVLLALVDSSVSWQERILGMFAVSVPMACLLFFVPGSFGGGDIKFVAAVGVAIGVKLVVMGSAAAILLAGIYCIRLLAEKRNGNPYTSVVRETKDDSVIVAEMSSFQLETIHTFCPKVSAILNITPDHLNRHHTMEAYIEAKEQIAKNQTEEDVCVLNYEDDVTRKFGERVKAQVIYFSSRRRLEKGIYLEDGNIVYCRENPEKVCHVDELKLLGMHNYENVMAAVAMAAAYHVPMEIIRKTIREFTAVEHRIEFVAEKNGVAYYNDSKGTNPDAAIKGIQAMNRPTFLIGGGYDKDSSYDEWIQSFDGKVKKLVLLGATKEKINETAKRLGFTDTILADTFEEAVNICVEQAEPGDAVLLSPACASWGMFKNYEERGDKFKELVNQL